jgi:hypothetical protein
MLAVLAKVSFILAEKISLETSTPKRSDSCKNTKSKKPPAKNFKPSKRKHVKFCGSRKS